MLKRVIGVFCAALTGCAVTNVAEAVPDLAAQEDIAPGDAVQVMVLGSFHFAGSTSDLINAEPDNVLAPNRQTELRALAKRLAAFSPTVIVTERVTSPPDYVDTVYETFDEEMLRTVPNERVQIAYRVASMVEGARVLGIDERPSDGEPDYFPFGDVMAHAKKAGSEDAINAHLADAEARVSAEMEKFAALSMGDALYEVNNGFLSSPEFYYRLIPFDEGEAQPVAELQAYWFMRNAKIFSKLEDVTEAGDRVLIVYGAGHKFWLDHFSEQTPGFVKVDPSPFLKD